MKTAKPKAQHPAEIAAEEAMIEAIRGADHFIASLFKGAGVYEKSAPEPTVMAALGSAAVMETLSRRTMRCMIYAVAPDGRATLLTRELIKRLMAMGPK